MALVQGPCREMSVVEWLDEGDLVALTCGSSGFTALVRSLQQPDSVALPDALGDLAGWEQWLFRTGSVALQHDFCSPTG